MDVLSSLEAVVHSTWLLPVLVVMIAVDAPFPVLPSETLLMTAVAGAFAADDVPFVLALFVAAVLGSVTGDLITFGLGRTSHRLIAGSAAGGARVRGHLLRRPGAVLVGARFLPGGRLVSTAAAGRFGLRVRPFLIWSSVSSSAWAVYMLGVGRALEPMTGGDPLLCVLGATALALVTGGLFAVGRRMSARRCG
ncbi:MAG: VTT domain-containing protein [Pseudonocardia sp.]|nr:VTT domain-containing protein [Pseudonocardia sp.]